jgi:MinD-like ATPase involved in chromosome partitioning or flagellar assembly
VREWGDKGTPIVQAMPNSAIAIAYMGIADKLVQAVSERADQVESAGPVIDRGDRGEKTDGKRHLPVSK